MNKQDKNQAIEVLKLIIGIGKPLKNRLLTYDALKLRWREIGLKKNPECPVCGENLNENLCNHEPENVDPRLLILKSLLDKDK